MAQLETLLAEGRHGEAADLCMARGDHRRAAELYAAVWRWDEAIEAAERGGHLELAYQLAVSANDHPASARILNTLLMLPEPAGAAARHAEAKRRWLDAAMLSAAAGELDRAAVFYEQAGELVDAARLHQASGRAREAGRLYERRLEAAPDDAEAALQLGRILTQFGRWDAAVGALQRAVGSAEHEVAALRLLVGCFAGLGLNDAAEDRLDALRRLRPEFDAELPAFLAAAFGDPGGLKAQLEPQPPRPAQGGAPREGAGGDLLAARYRVLRTLGGGATGRVVLAHDLVFERDVAIKILLTGASGRDADARFAKEAQIAASLHHPNVVRVLEWHPDGPFIVMEYMRGGTLEDRLAPPGAESQGAAASLTRRVMQSTLSGLQAVHRFGVVHRDIKPANLFFSEAGDIKLGDFGVAHLTDAGSTMTGAMLGSVPYMAPEQITGVEAPSAATDLYALGVVFFRCLTGRLPFPGPDFVSQHLSERPPAPSEVASIGTGFDALVARMLAKDPSERPASADDVLADLADLPWSALPDEVADAHSASRALAPSAAARQGAASDAVHEGGARYALALNAVAARGGQILEDRRLGRTVERIPVGPDRIRRLLDFARADHPFLQAVYDLEEVDEGGHVATLEHPAGAPLQETALDTRSRGRALAQVREALTQLHRVGVTHGRVSGDHVWVGKGRAVLRIELEPPAGSPAEDLAQLDALR